MKFSAYIAKHVDKHGVKGFRDLLNSQGFDSKGHKVFPRIVEIHNQPNWIRVVDEHGESVKVMTSLGLFTPAEIATISDFIQTNRHEECVGRKAILIILEQRGLKLCDEQALVERFESQYQAADPSHGSFFGDLLRCLPAGNHPDSNQPDNTHVVVAHLAKMAAKA